MQAIFDQMIANIFDPREKNRLQAERDNILAVAEDLMRARQTLHQVLLYHIIIFKLIFLSNQDLNWVWMTIGACCRRSSLSFVVLTDFFRRLFPTYSLNKSLLYLLLLPFSNLLHILVSFRRESAAVWCRFEAPGGSPRRQNPYEALRRDPHRIRRKSGTLPSLYPILIISFDLYWHFLLYFICFQATYINV